MEAHCEVNVTAFQREIMGISPLALSSTKTLQIFNMFTTYAQILRFFLNKEVHEEDTNPYTTITTYIIPASTHQHYSYTVRGVVLSSSCHKPGGKDRNAILGKNYLLENFLKLFYLFYFFLEWIHSKTNKPKKEKEKKTGCLLMITGQSVQWANRTNFTQ